MNNTTVSVAQVNISENHSSTETKSGYTPEKVNSALRWWMLDQLCIQTSVSPTTRAVMQAILAFTNKDKLYAFAKYDTLAERAGTSVKSVQRSVKELEKLGWLSVKRSINQNNEYSPVWDKAGPPFQKPSRGDTKSPQGDTKSPRRGDTVTSDTKGVSLNSEVIPFPQSPQRDAPIVPAQPEWETIEGVRYPSAKIAEWEKTYQGTIRVRQVLAAKAFIALRDYPSSMPDHVAERVAFGGRQLAFAARDAEKERRTIFATKEAQSKLPPPPVRRSRI